MPLAGPRDRLQVLTIMEDHFSVDLRGHIHFLRPMEEHSPVDLRDLRQGHRRTKACCSASGLRHLPW